MSPVDIRATPYVTLPMAADAEKTITAVKVAFDAGGANDQLRDNLIGGSAMLMQSRAFGHFQAYYGAAFGMGDYTVSQVVVYPDPFSSAGFDTGSYRIGAVKKYYGYYGLNGGVNVVIPFGNGKGEWRAFGVDLGYRKEFGDFLRYRRSLPEDKINILASYGHLFTVGGSTEIIGRNSKGFQIGYRIAAGGMLLPPGQYTGGNSGQRPFYICQTLSVTKNRVTGYMQLTGGTHATAFQTGVNINLLTRKLPFANPEARPRKPGRQSDRPRRLRPFEKRRIPSGEHD